jgi:SlyX protein
MEDRLIEVETRLAFQDDTLQALNDVVAHQQQEIDLLRREIEALKAQLKAMAPSLVASRTEESPPPHY